MTSNNETVSRQMPLAGNNAKTMTSNWKQFTVTREMLTAVARDGWNLSAVFKFCFYFVLLYNKSLNDWSLGEQRILFPSNLNVSRDEVEKQNSLFPSGPVIKCLLLYSWRFSRYSVPIHRLVHGHMTSNNETVSRQMP